MGNQIEKAIFIGGCERSGTTLLGAMLGAHSDCVCTPESQFRIEVLQSFGWNEMNANIPSALNAIKDHWRFKLWNLNMPPAPRECPVKESYAALLYWLVAQYSERMDKTTATVWVDHTPHNVRYATALGEIFSDMKLIHIVRDGRAVANSIIPLDWGPNTVIKAAPWWVEKVAYGLAVETRWPESRITRIRYEDLVQSPEATLKRLCKFLGIDYQSKMARATGFRRPDYTKSQHSLIGKGPDASRISAWKEDLTPRQIELFEYLTRDFLRYLGYILECNLETSSPTRLERFSAEVWEIVKGKFIDGLRYRIRKYSGVNR
jgi:hypothetical protein